MKKRYLIIGLVVLLITVGLCGCFEKTQDSRLSGLGYMNSNYGFGFNPPAGWTFTENDPFGAIVRFYGPTVDELNINLGVNGPATLIGDQTLSSITDQTIETYTNLFNNFTLLSRNSRLVNDMNAYEFVYTYSLNTSQLKQKQVLVEENRKIFIFTFAAGINSYDDYISIVEESIDSLVII